jgi:two-component system, chemotaxis family, CheB/CheR fusion protein
MLLDSVPSRLDYAERLRAHPKELEALYQDLLIGVTSFFRDPHAFEFLQRKVFPGLVKDRAADDAVRVWVSGCSTGQEAYSLAMAYLEFAAQAGVNVPLRVFATDLNQANLEKARAGLYTESLMHNVSKERQKRFFTEESGSYRISKSVRELVVFAHHNVFADPPFSHMDVISCRNLLIYLEPSLQSRVIPTFHYALKPDGVLVLGASETIGRHTDLFTPLDNRCRVYTKLPTTARMPRPATPFAAPSAAKYGRDRAVLTADAPDVDALREADRLVISRYAPAGVVIDNALEVVQFRGMTGRFLEPPSGKASFNLLKMAREGLMLPLRALIERANHENRAVRQEGVRFQRDGHAETVNLEVVPLRQPPSLLVLFEATAPMAEIALEPPRLKSKRVSARDQSLQADDGNHRAEQLQHELLETRDYLRFIQEQGEAANEELQSTNEEAQSANEEMQSLNEELETAKEELESSNEEMRTINEELNERNAELRHLNDDHLNFQASSELAIVAIGADLCVRRFTPQAELVLGLRASDIGRPIGNVRHGLELPDLEALIAEVITSATATDREVRDHKGRWFLLRVRPYHTLEKRIEGAVVVFFDMNTLKRAELERERLQHETEVAFESLGDGLLALGRDWTVTYINTAGASLAGLSREAMLGGHFWALFPELSDSIFGPAYRKAMTERVTVELEASYTPLETQFDIRAVPVEAGIMVFFRDVTARRRAELALEETQAQLRVLAESQRRFLADAAHELRAPLAVIQGNLEVLERFPDMSATERLEAVAESANSAARLGRLTNDLLTLARGDSGDGLRLERLEIVPILEETLKELSRLSDELRLEPGTLEPCSVLGDRDKLKQLFLILLDNALKYTPAGGRVSLELHRQDTHAEFRVSNTGPSISPEDLERVFERFYRTDASRSRQTGGTGLGLPIARWIAGQHGGTVQLESQPGVGTTAIVRLPLINAG